MSMEFLTYPYMELFFKEDADKYRYQHLADGLEFIPYGAQLLTAATLTTLNYDIVMSPVEIVPYMWYCWILAAFGLLSIFVPYADGTCRKDPWNWEYDVAESGVAEKKTLLEKGE